MWDRTSVIAAAVVLTFLGILGVGAVSLVRIADSQPESFGGLGGLGGIKAQPFLMVGEHGVANSAATTTYFHLGDISVQGSVSSTNGIVVSGTATSTFAGVSATSVSSTRVNAYTYAFSDSGSIRWETVLGSSQARLTQGGVHWITASAGSGLMTLLNTRFSTDPLPSTDAARSVGVSSLRYLNGWFSGTVTSTNYEATGAIRIANGTAGAPAIHFASDLDTGIYSSGVGNISLATGGSQKFRCGTTNCQITGGIHFTPTTDATTDIGNVAPLLRFRHGVFSGRVQASSTLMVGAENATTTLFAQTNTPAAGKGTCLALTDTDGTQYWYSSVGGVLTSSTQSCE